MKSSLRQERMHVSNDVKMFEKVKIEGGPVMHGQQMNKNLFAVSTCDVRNNVTDQVIDEVTRNSVRDGSVSDVEQQQLLPMTLGDATKSESHVTHTGGVATITTRIY
ncbi:hypothetical protein AMTR_s00051p00169130 [Amborella trichopoda]|uniref:Uncharacterized protein n=1 Tax=Amborella trichopoda TaxID=13333 RepID=U5D355_AMBTC|nr:hypothetical protein AMTR_s00051p00169130 [Amborella trichopoda]